MRPDDVGDEGAEREGWDGEGSDGEGSEWEESVSKGSECGSRREAAGRENSTYFLRYGSDLHCAG